jgi:hypothetical protein
MTIITVQYTDDAQQTVQVTYDDGTQQTVPVAAGNRHWQQVQAWQDEGNTPGLAPSAVRAPQPFTRTRPEGKTRTYYERELIYG